MSTFDNAGSSYVSWGAILAGSVLAGAFSIVMLQFGSAIGLTSTDLVTGDAVVTPGKMVAIGVWLLWVQVLASMIGGYLAGRMRQPVSGATPHEMEVRDGAHGLMVWATGTLAVFAAGGIVAALAAMGPETPVEAAVIKTPELLANQDAVAIISAFALGATSLVSGVAAWWSGTKGGDHRDNNIDLSGYFSFRR